jgi:tetratricopeptide (TPR) repeat protein
MPAFDKIGDNAPMLRRTLATASLALALLAFAAPPASRVAAEDAGAIHAGPASAGRARARALFASGVAAAQRGAWDEARARFEEAYALVKASTVLFNLAGAQRRTGQLLAAHANYRRVAAASEPALSAQLKRQAKTQADAIEAVIPRLRLEIGNLRGEDRVVLDQQRIYADELGRDLWLDPGAHRLAVERAHNRSELRTFRLAEREVRVLSLQLP